jgi:hypothetical protein
VKVIKSLILFFHRPYNNQLLYSANACVVAADHTLEEMTRFMKKGEKRFMWQDLKECKMFSKIRSN